MTIYEDRLTKRLGLVEEHVNQENSHDLGGVLATFGEAPVFEDAPWAETHEGRQEVRRHYEELLHAVPDLHITIGERHVASEAVILEVTVRGTHLGTWRGLPPTGRSLDFPLCAVFTFDEEERLAGERIYYDLATVLGQLGVFHDPESVPGRLVTTLAHPLTMGRALGRMIVRKS